jgi:DNA-binding MarR family transcriptional regulator
MAERKSSQAVEAADRFHSAAIHALRHVRREDPATGVPAARLSALSVLVFGGRRTLSELAAAEQVRPPTMTRIVQALERERRVENLAALLGRLSPDEVARVREAAELVERASAAGVRAGGP